MTTEDMSIALQIARDQGWRMFQDYLEQTGTDIRLLPVNPKQRMDLLEDMYVSAFIGGIKMGARLDRPPGLDATVRVEQVDESSVLVFAQGETVIRVPLNDTAQGYLVAELSGGKKTE